MSSFRNLASSNVCSVDGTSTAANPLIQLINKFFGFSAPPAASSYVLHNLSPRELVILEQEIKMGTGELRPTPRNIL